MITSPFKFLDAYTREDREIFFGRDREIEELYQKVFESRVLLVCGVSGTGKTSLINCGLANKFQESDWLPIHVRRGNDISANLQSSITRLAITPVKEDQPVVKRLQSLYLDHFKPIYLIFDQFEELFIFGDRQERADFIKEIRTIIDSEVQCRLLFVMREEYLAGAIEFEKEIPTFLANRIRIERMTWHSARQVIEEPCKVSGIEIEAELTGAILEKLSPESTEVELTYLQVLLDKMFRLAIEKNNEKPLFTHNLISGMGDVSDLLGSFLEEQIGELEDPDMGLVVLKSFVSVRGTKRQVTGEDIQDFARTLGKDITETTLRNLVQKFIALRILRDKDENGRYELRHDSLAAKIYEKITLVEKELLEIRAFLENAYNNFEKRKKLLGTDDLEYIAPYENKLILRPAIVRFIESSKREVLKAKRRRRQLVSAASMTLILVLTGFTIWALSAKKRSEENLAKSRASNLNFQAAELVRTDPNSALRLAEYAHGLDPANKSIQKNINKIYYGNSVYKTLGICDSPIFAMDISPDGELIAVGTDDGEVFLYDLSGNRLQEFRGHEGTVRSLCFSPDGKNILTGSFDGSARLWDLEGKVIKEYWKHNKEIWAVNISPDGERFLTGGGDSTAILWSREGSVLHEFVGFDGYVMDVSFSPDGSGMLFGTSTGLVRICNPEGKTLTQFRAHDNWTFSVKYSPDGNSILTSSADGHNRLWDLKGNQLIDFAANFSTKDFSAFSPAGNLILTCSGDYVVRIWDTKGNLFHSFQGHTGRLFKASFSPDLNSLITVSIDRSIRKWNLGYLPVYEFHIPKEIEWPGITTSRDGNRILTVGPGDKNAYLWDMTGGLIQIFEGDKEIITSLGFTPDGTQIATGSQDGTVRVYDLDGNTLLMLKGHNGQITSIDFSASGDTLLTTSMDSTVGMWNREGERFWLDEYNYPVTNAKFSPDGNSILIGGYFSDLALIDYSSGVWSFLEGHTSGNTCLAFSHDGKWMLSGSTDNTVRLWDRGGKERAVCRGHTGMITSVGFSPDGGKIISTAMGDNIRLWDLEGNELCQLFSYDNNDLAVPGGNADPDALDQTPCAIYLPETDTIFTITTGGTGRYWNVKTEYDPFRELNEYDPLAIDRKIEYGIISFNEIKRNRSIQDLTESAEYYLDSSRLFTEAQKYDSYLKAHELYHKINSIDPTPRSLRQEIESLFRLYLIQRSKEIPRTMDRLYDRILQTGTLQELDESAMYFFDPVYYAYYQGFKLPPELKFAEKALHLFRLATASETDEFPRDRISSRCHLIARYFIRQSQYDNSLLASEASYIADPTFTYSKMGMAYAYLLSDQYDAAVSLIDLWKDSVMTSGEYSIRFKDQILWELNRFEQDGITHPDFEKVRALLKE